MKKACVVFLYLVLCVPAAQAAMGGDHVYAALWDSVAASVERARYESADKTVEVILDRARKQGDAEHWTRALVERLGLRWELGAPETALHDLRDASWPESSPWRDVVELYYAKALLQYRGRYSYEIRKREAVADSNVSDLKKWTHERIATEINAAMLHVWSKRSDWSSESRGVWSDFIEQNNYPPRIRGSLRDAITYLWVEYLADTSYWTPEQMFETNKLHLEPLLAAGEALGDTLDIADPRALPLFKVRRLLRELRDWHQSEGRVGAALEAELEFLRRVNGVFDRPDDRIRIREVLEQLLADWDDSDPWWSMGQWQLATLLRREDEGDSLVRAHAAAARGIDRHPESLGASFCDRARRQIETESFEITAMSHDAPQKRSIRIEHANIDRLHFGAWRFDLGARVEQDDAPRPTQKETDALIAAAAPDLEWTVDLPATEDYRPHVSYTGLPRCEPGAYVVVASREPGFVREANRMRAVLLIIGDLVLTEQDLGEGQVEFMVRTGSAGDPVANAKITIFEPRRHGGVKIVKRLETDSGGRAGYKVGNPTNCQALARHGDDLAWLEGVSWQRPGGRRPTVNSFVYTDRAVYRPGQTVYWKIVGYAGNPEQTEFHTLPDQADRVCLMDANGQESECAEVTTNAFGSADGSFVIPDTGLLGGWAIRDGFGGTAGFRVEQYKRPTFEVRLLESEGSPRLGDRVRLAGRVDYRFGMPVTSGDVAWRVTRTGFQAPRNGGRHIGSGSGVVASGQSALDEEGRFRLEFETAADLEVGQIAGLPVLVSYRVNVEVTDSGGETRTSSRTYTLGTAAVAVNMFSDQGFVLAGEAAVMSVRRMNLDGAALPGRGSWSLLSLRQPEQVELPTVRPAPVPANRLAAAATPGDSLLPRWERYPDASAELAKWEASGVVATGMLDHAAAGLALIRIPELGAGAYRLAYETADDAGGRCVAQQEFVVVDRDPSRLQVPLFVAAERQRVAVGDTARFVVHSGLPNQFLQAQIFVGGRRLESRFLRGGVGSALLEVPVTKAAHDGLRVEVSAIRDFQALNASVGVAVPWDEQALDVSFSTFRDRMAPGSETTVTVTVKCADQSRLDHAATELLASMYDASLDDIAPYHPPQPLSLFYPRSFPGPFRCGLGSGHTLWHFEKGLPEPEPLIHLWPDRLVGIPTSAAILLPEWLRWSVGFDRHGVRPEVALALKREGVPILQPFEVEGAEYMVEIKSAVTAHAIDGDTFERYAVGSVEDALSKQAGVVYRAGELRVRGGRSEDLTVLDNELAGPPPPPPPLPRRDFAETAFFLPHVLVDGHGRADITFKVPDSVTDWNLWVQALTRDLRSGSARRRAASLKDLMVRPYLPRFLREGDAAELKVVVNNAGDARLSGRLEIVIEDADSGDNLNEAFGLTDAQRKFHVEAGAAAALTFPLKTPPHVGTVVVKALARAGRLTDGEQRPLPILPGRMHLLRSRFAAIDGVGRRNLSAGDAASAADSTLVQEQLVVTIDAQLFDGMLQAVPYLVSYPYECIEQTLNRYLSTGILAAVFAEHPQVRAMAASYSDRQSRTEPWNQPDANRSMLLEESPWFVSATGKDTGLPLIDVLDPIVVKRERESALAKLKRRQASDGGFGWFDGGHSSPHLTLYVLQGLARGAEFGVEAPPAIVERAWRYLHAYFAPPGEEEPAPIRSRQQQVLLSYLLAVYPAETWHQAGFSDDDRAQLLDSSFSQWRELPLMLRDYLMLALLRADRAADARIIFDAVMDAAHEDPELGVHWTPEDRAWIWYNDTIESHALTLCVLMELAPDDPRGKGLVRWLFSKRKLGHWTSTRATAEVIYALTKFLQREGTLGARDEIDVGVGGKVRKLVFEPAESTGGHRQLVYPGDAGSAEPMATVEIEKKCPGLAFATATWSFSTEQMPSQADGDLFSVTREYFRRHHDGRQWVLTPLDNGERVAVGDQVEVHLSISARQESEYVHLRDPRGAGFEPETAVSGYRWQGGLGYYEEIRDSGANYFFDRLPMGQYTLVYRLRANMAGTFKVGPATLQSLYAPEFAAHSAGWSAEVAP